MPWLDELSTIISDAAIAEGIVTALATFLEPPLKDGSHALGLLIAEMFGYVLAAERLDNGTAQVAHRWTGRLTGQMRGLQVMRNYSRTLPLACAHGGRAPGGNWRTRPAPGEVEVRR